MGTSIQRIRPCLWFDSEAEEAARFYIKVFQSVLSSASEAAPSKILEMSYYTPANAVMAGKAVGSVLTVTFLLSGQEHMGINGGPVFQFSEAISLCVHCKTQEEVDGFWYGLSDGGDPSAQQCGWLKDKFGVSWQIIPDVLLELMSDANPEKAQRVVQAMLSMKKLDISLLKHAYEG